MAKNFSSANVQTLMLRKQYVHPDKQQPNHPFAKPVDLIGLEELKINTSPAQKSYMKLAQFFGENQVPASPKTSKGKSYYFYLISRSIV